MSGVFKKIVKGITKVFKKIVKVVKKIVKSKIFKVIVMAAAVYFTAGAALGAMGGAAAGTGMGTVGSMSLAGGIDAAVAAGASSVAGVSTASGVMGSLVSGAKAAGTFLKDNSLLASTGLQMGSALMAGKAEEKAEDEERDRRETNAGTKLDVYGDTKGIMQSVAQQKLAKSDANGQSVYAQPAMAQVQPSNIENSTQKYFNSSDNTWKNVGA